MPATERCVRRHANLESPPSTIGASEGRRLLLYSLAGFHRQPHLGSITRQRDAGKASGLNDQKSPETAESTGKNAMFSLLEIQASGVKSHSVHLGRFWAVMTRHA